MHCILFKRHLSSGMKRFVNLYDITNPVPYLQTWEIQKRLSQELQEENIDRDDEKKIKSEYDSILLLEHSSV